MEVRLKDTKTHGQISGALSVSGRLNFSRSGTQGRSIGNCTLCTHKKTDYNAMLSLIDWISDTRSQGCIDLQSLLKCLVKCNALCYMCSLDRCTEYDESHETLLSSMSQLMCNAFTYLCSFDLCHLHLKLLSACLEVLQYPVFDL